MTSLSERRLLFRIELDAWREELGREVSRGFEA
jgi:hypothetical protein